MLKRILGLVGWLGVALVCGGVAIRLLKPELMQWSRGLALAGLVCVVLYMLSQWREIARSFEGREARYGSVAVVSTLLVLAILVGVNYLGSRYNKRFDLTAAKQYTLSDQTRKILASLERPVSIKVFAAPDDFQRFRDRLSEYEYASSQVSTEYIDAVKQPSRAKQYGVQSLGTVVFEYEGRTERVTSDGEQELTNGLIKVIQGTQYKVYVVGGHGERSHTASDAEGYSQIVSALNSENYAVEPLVLAQQKEVPADASVLVIPGPSTDLFPPEIEMLKRYLARGGKLFVLVDPPEKPGDSPDLPNLKGLLAEWAIEVGNDVVVDISGVGQLLGTGPETPVAARYQSHPITSGFNLLTAYRLARSVAPVTGNTSGKFAQTLVETSSQSWAETDVKGLMTSGQVKRDLEGGDKAGPISLAAAVSSPATETPPDSNGDTSSDGDKKPEDTRKPETRIVVFGDSDFAANGGLGVPGNRDLFINAVNWLAQQENLISIRPRDPEDRRVTLTAERQRIIWWLVIVIIPGTLLLAGVQTWWRRR